MSGRRGTTNNMMSIFQQVDGKGGESVGEAGQSINPISRLIQIQQVLLYMNALWQTGSRETTTLSYIYHN